jgi:hypothetical protein
MYQPAFAQAEGAPAEIAPWIIITHPAPSPCWREPWRWGPRLRFIPQRLGGRKAMRGIDVPNPSDELAEPRTTTPVVWSVSSLDAVPTFPTHSQVGKVAIIRLLGTWF